ncbi:MAG: HAD family hydrolase [Burkholderiales bacterium]
MRLALFDLDNTLLAGDSDYEWAQFLIDRGVLERATYEAKNDAFYADYKRGALDIHAFLDFQLAPLARYPRAELDRWHAEFMAERIAPLIRPKARALVAQHAGDLSAVITATNRFVTGPIAQAFGVTHLIATEVEESAGRFTGRPSGTPCFREGKITRLNEWLSAQGRRLTDFETSVFYSDSLNDLPLLSAVTEPVAVDPDPVLAAHARAQGWRTLSLA